MLGLVDIIHKDNQQKDLLDRLINSIHYEPWYKIDRFLKDKFIYFVRLNFDTGCLLMKNDVVGIIL